MSLRAALLALLTSGPMTGYDAAKQFSSSVGHVWQAPDSQIYPELRKMEGEGLLASKDVPWGSRGATKTQYSVTPEGVEALRQWQAQPQEYVRDRDPARLHAAYFEWAPPGAALAQLESHIEHFTTQREQALQQIDEIRTRTHPTLTRRLEATPPELHDAAVAFKLFAYEGQRDRADVEIAWAQRGLELLRTMSADEG